MKFHQQIETSSAELNLHREQKIDGLGQTLGPLVPNFGR